MRLYCLRYQNSKKKCFSNALGYTLVVLLLRH